MHPGLTQRPLGHHELHKAHHHAFNGVGLIHDPKPLAPEIAHKVDFGKGVGGVGNGHWSVKRIDLGHRIRALVGVVAVRAVHRPGHPGVFPRHDGVTAITRWPVVLIHPTLLAVGSVQPSRKGKVELVGAVEGRVVGPAFDGTGVREVAEELVLERLSGADVQRFHRGPARHGLPNHFANERFPAPGRSIQHDRLIPLLEPLQDRLEGVLLVGAYLGVLGG